MMIEKCWGKKVKEKKIGKTEMECFEADFPREKVEGGKGLTRNFEKSSKIKNDYSHFSQIKEENKKEESKMAEREKQKEDVPHQFVVKKTTIFPIHLNTKVKMRKLEKPFFKT